MEPHSDQTLVIPELQFQVNQQENEQETAPLTWNHLLDG